MCEAIHPRNNIRFIKVRFVNLSAEQGSCRRFK